MAATTVLSLWQAKDSIVETGTMLVKDFFAPEHVQSIVGPVKFECKLAPVFPDKEGLDKVTDDTKVMVAVGNKLLLSSLPTATKFEDVQGVFNAKLQIVSSAKGEPEQINKIVTTKDKSFFEFDASSGPSGSSVQLIQDWIASDLITDPGILATSGLDNRETIRGLITISKGNYDLISTKVQDETLVADIGILSYPNPKDETFRITDVKLFVWIKETNIGRGSIKSYEVGLRGSYFSQLYEPSNEGIKKLAPHTIEGALGDYKKFVSEVGQFVKDRP
ncbi:hypothetical protein K438DRAFT_1873342 [Mycena galopus ATCC 62051]|nr:hypothetical protein K438DRAFT_1873342 [Mycena galopus ATCC 62051]